MIRAPARAHATAAPRWKSTVAGDADSWVVRPSRLRSMARRRAAVRVTTRAPCACDPFPPAGLERGQRTGRRRRARALRRAVSRLRARRAIVQPKHPARRSPRGPPGTPGRGDLRVGVGATVDLDEA